MLRSVKHPALCDSFAFNLEDVMTRRAGPDEAGQPVNSLSGLDASDLWGPFFMQCDGRRSEYTSDNTCHNDDE